MRKKQTLESLIRERIKNGKEGTYVYADFLDLSDRDQIGRVLRKMVKKNELIRYGQGVYVRTRKSTVTGELIADGGLRTIAEQAFKKLNIKIVPTTADIRYMNGSTQVPTGWCVGVTKKVTRKIGHGGYSIKYERMHI
jgi:hypothetical protein